MNIENLCSIGAIEEELREAVLFYRANGRAGEIVKEQFQIVDELGDCRRLFAQLNETPGKRSGAAKSRRKAHLHGFLHSAYQYNKNFRHFGAHLKKRMD